MHSLIELKTLVSSGRDPARSLPLRRGFLLIPLTVLCFAFSPKMQANLPPELILPGSPDGCYPAFTTAEGCNALLLLGGGIGNSAFGWYANFLAGDANFNTSLGAGTLALTSGAGSDSNTAVGTAAMILNLGGNDNTAVGTNALVFNTVAAFNNAMGTFAMYNNDSSGNGLGSFNVAIGGSALFSNVDGGDNTAVGDLALAFNDASGLGLANGNVGVGSLALFLSGDGSDNDAVGFAALGSNVTGFQNQAMGSFALNSNATGFSNVGIGDSALVNATDPWWNTVVGWNAGGNIDIGIDNIYIGESVAGPGDESFTTRIGAFQSACYIDGIYGAIVDPATWTFAIIDSTGKLGTVISAERFKHDIKPMDKTSETIFSLKPVTFHYKADPKGIPQYGLIAEDVAKVDPNLVVRDKTGTIMSVHYEQVWNMMLNEFLKEHRTVQELQATAEKQQATIAALTASLREQAAQIQKVSAQLETMRPAPQVVENR